MEFRDLIIVGAGPAGLAASIYAARAGLSVLVLEKALAGGMLLSIPTVENYPGFPGGISGMELAERMKKQAVEAGAEIRELEEVLELDVGGDIKIVRTGKGEYKAKAVILATGWSPLKLGVPGEEELLGRGVSYCVVCDGPLFRRKKVAIAGGGEQAVASALYMADIASDVLLVHVGRKLRASEALIQKLSEKGVQVLLRSKIRALKGEQLLEAIVVEDLESRETREIPVNGLFVQVGIKPNNELAKAIGVELDKRGYIVVDGRQRTNIEGVLAAGDVTNHPVKQVCTSVAQGAVAALEAASFVKGVEVG